MVVVQTQELFDPSSPPCALYPASNNPLLSFKCGALLAGDSTLSRVNFSQRLLTGCDSVRACPADPNHTPWKKRFHFWQPTHVSPRMCLFTALFVTVSLAHWHRHGEWPLTTSQDFPHEPPHDPHGPMTTMTGMTVYTVSQNLHLTPWPQWYNDTQKHVGLWWRESLKHVLQERPLYPLLAISPSISITRLVPVLQQEPSSSLISKYKYKYKPNINTNTNTGFFLTGTPPKSYKCKKVNPG